MKLDSLRGKYALITGSSKGIGFSIACALGQQGCKVAIIGRKKKFLDQCSNKLNQMSISHLTFNENLIDSKSSSRIMKIIAEVWGRLDILVNNVGGLPKKGNFFELSDQDWKDCHELNVLIPVRFTREAFPLLKKSNQPRVINISSFVASQPGSYNPHYSACKTAILNLTKHCSNLFAQYGILVNSILPGNIETEFWNEYIEEKAIELQISVSEARDIENKRVTEPTPLKRLGLPEEIANMVVFLASDKASFITGTNLPIDGGRTRCI